MSVELDIYSMFYDTEHPMNIKILALDGIFDTGLSTLLDTIAVANLLGAKQNLSVSNKCISFNDEIISANGFKVSTHSINPEDELPDVLVVPALGCLTPDTLCDALNRADVIEASKLIEGYKNRGVQIATACTGTFVVGLSGILNGLEATTTWWLEPLFRNKYPDVKLDASRMLIEQKGVVTAGAALGHVDLALWLVRQVSPELAYTSAQYLLFNDRMLQASYAMADHLAHNDPMVAKFENLARTHLDDFSIEKAAKAVGTSQRTLQRKVQSVLGRTPVAYVQDIRVQKASYLLRTSKSSLEEVAEKVGYADAVTLRTVLRKKTGKGVKELRQGL